MGRIFKVTLTLSEEDRANFTQNELYICFAKKLKGSEFQSVCHVVEYDLFTPLTPTITLFFKEDYHLYFREEETEENSLLKLEESNDVANAYTIEHVNVGSKYAFFKGFSEIGEASDTSSLVVRCDKPKVCSLALSQYFLHIKSDNANINVNFDVKLDEERRKGLAGGVGAVGLSNVNKSSSVTFTLPLSPHLFVFVAKKPFATRNFVFSLKEARNQKIINPSDIIFEDFGDEYDDGNNQDDSSYEKNISFDTRTKKFKVLD